MTVAEVWWQKLSELLSPSSSLPEQWRRTELRQLPILAVDLELTSLDTQKAKVTSIGWVEGNAGNINLASCYYKVIRAKGDLAQSPVIHGLTAGDLSQGAHIKEALELLKPYANSHIWLFHNAALDVAVLKRVTRYCDVPLNNIVTLDTLRLAVYQLEKEHQVVPQNSASLTACRERLGLPEAPAHNALDDAMATLQLWYAQIHDLVGNGSSVLADLLHTRALSVVNMGEKS